MNRITKCLILNLRITFQKESVGNVTQRLMKSMKSQLVNRSILSNIDMIIIIA